jgi:arginyl-tRNA--protein-N-Asp/Glu arginylyltransferase
MQQTRSVRIDVAKFNLSSENRRILKKVFDISILAEEIPYRSYTWEIAKLAKDFYSIKFGQNIKAIMGAAKVKEILTEPTKSNFNKLLVFSQKEDTLGYAICYANPNILHYSYPFYDLDKSPKDMGLGMMTLAVEYAKKSGLKYLYLGSLQRPSDTYKLQFAGLEWFDGQKWSTDEKKVREILAAA